MGAERKGTNRAERAVYNISVPRLDASFGSFDSHHGTSAMVLSLSTKRGGGLPTQPEFLGPPMALGTLELLEIPSKPPNASH